MNKQLTIIFIWNLLNGIVGLSVNQTNTTTTTAAMFASQYNETNSVKKLANYKLPAKVYEAQYMSEVGSRCIDDGFYPDKEDCRKFHVCYSGTQSIRWCKEGMLWDETKIGCSAQNTTLCAGGRKKWGQNEDNTNLVSRSGKGNYTCRPGANGLFADPSSCSIYHWCVLGVLHSTHQCTPGHHFSASASGCVWPKDAECEGQIAPPYSPIDCALGSSGYFPDPYDCSVFHYCDGNKPRSESLLCSAGRIWSTRLENCAWPHEVPECQNICPANYSSQMRFADPVVCSQYIQCVDGHLEPRTCSNNFLFDRITKTCKPYEQAECHGDKPNFFTSTTTISPVYSESSPEKRRGNQINCAVDGYFGDAHDCNTYHVCVDGRDYRSNCAIGLGWEPLLRLCMPTHLVNCPTSKSIDSSIGSSKKKWFHLFTQTAVRTTTTTTTTTTTASSANSPFNLPSIFTCSGRTNGYYADPMHCTKFHYCGTGWHSVMECEKGLAYSARDHDCVPIELANCGNKRSIRS